MNFELTHLPERTVKPRKTGVTMVMDKGLSIRQTEDLITMSGDRIDLLKLGFGTSYFTNNLKEKIKLYKDADMKVYVGGTLFEAFLIRNMFDDYRRMLDKFGLNAAEVSDGSMIIPHEEKLKYISKLAKDVTVVSEVGSKEEGILISPGKWIKMMRDELDAGSWKVIAEGRESGTVGIFRPNGQPHTILINKIKAKVNDENIIWEAPQKKQCVWFIRILGCNVNLGNIAPHDVIPIETLRYGLRGDTFHQFLPEEFRDKKLTAK